MQNRDKEYVEKKRLESLESEVESFKPYLSYELNPDRIRFLKGDDKVLHRQKTNTLADELLATSAGATVGTLGATIALSTLGILAPVIGSVAGGAIGLTAIKLIERKRETLNKKMILTGSPMNISVADLRQNYTRAGLSETDAKSNPFQQFSIWFAEAVSAQIIEPNAMTLATADSEGNPSARMVLLKDFDDRGFVFYTNYESCKGEQLKSNPSAALVFWWAELERQVRIEGNVERVSDRESDEYFQSRPRNSQLGAWVSRQSEVIESREVLEKRLAQLEREYADKNLPRPSHWGGFRLIPNKIEFWQGRPSRLHDRLRYRLVEDGSWVRERLSP